LLVVAGVVFKLVVAGVLVDYCIRLQLRLVLEFIVLQLGRVDQAVSAAGQIKLMAVIQL
jgi:hypothetical protein